MGNVHAELPGADIYHAFGLYFYVLLMFAIIETMRIPRLVSVCFVRKCDQYQHITTKLIHIL